MFLLFRELDANEVRTMLASLHEGLIEKHILENTVRVLKNCSKEAGEEPIPSEYPITYNALLNCSNITDSLLSFYGKKLKNRFEIKDTDEVAFVMIGTNSTDVTRALDGIRHRKQRFICLNDNMNHSNPHSKEVVKVIHEFYLSLFPERSSFELPDGVFNKHLHLDEYLNAQQKQQLKRSIVYGLICTIFITVTLMVLCFSKKKRSSAYREREQRFLKLLNGV
eukprot:TRINITY_DN3965_c0_g1_i3.p1 TRINITY_DN3965_c0_g1~~TRINITY_DN3965_c0_g1_i3.p1  ORF type:complete len:223 (+),score=22.71 TRINITY_DN3965_c0_g1_i3:245-913(+)